MRFGDGTWPGHPPHACSMRRSRCCARRISPRDCPRLQIWCDETLLRSYRADDWLRWLAAAGIDPWPFSGPVFDSVAADGGSRHAGRGHCARAAALMFDREINTGRLVRPFDVEVQAGSYWLTWLKGKATCSIWTKKTP